jgi:hypothetical protein
MPQHRGSLLTGHHAWACKHHASVDCASSLACLNTSDAQNKLMYSTRTVRAGSQVHEPAGAVDAARACADAAEPDRAAGAGRAGERVWRARHAGAAARGRRLLRLPRPHLVVRTPAGLRRRIKHLVLCRRTCLRAGSPLPAAAAPHGAGMPPSACGYVRTAWSPYGLQGRAGSHAAMKHEQLMMGRSKGPQRTTYFQK